VAEAVDVREVRVRRGELGFKDVAHDNGIALQVGLNLTREIGRQRDPNGEINNQQQIHEQDRQAEKPFPWQWQFHAFRDTIADGLRRFNEIGGAPEKEPQQIIAIPARFRYTVVTV
jgi:hypothetical protein